MKHPEGPRHLCTLVCHVLLVAVNMLFTLGLDNYTPVEGRSSFLPRLLPPWLSGCIHQQAGNVFIIFIKTTKSNVAQMGLGGGMEGASA